MGPRLRDGTDHAQKNAHPSGPTDLEDPSLAPPCSNNGNNTSTNRNSSTACPGFREATRRHQGSIFWQQNSQKETGSLRNSDL